MHGMKLMTMATVMLSIVSFAFCGEVRAAKMKNCSPTETKAAMAAGDTNLLVLDVRTVEEFADAHIPGVRLIPVADLPDSVAALAPWKNRPIIVTCRSGNRSLRASDILIANGFTDVTNMTEGIKGWISRGYVVEKGAR